MDFFKLKYEARKFHFQKYKKFFNFEARKSHFLKHKKFFQGEFFFVFWRLGLKGPFPEIQEKLFLRKYKNFFYFQG